ncbi:MAG: sigma-70 family RNA polymerase sigma factor [Planctomycetota bacterium]
MTGQAPSEEELIRRFQGGDEEAFGALVERWAADLLRLAWRLTGRPEDAHDLRQQVLVQAWTALSSYRGKARPRTWLYRIALNLWRDRLRGESRRERLLDAARERLDAAGASPAADPEAVLGDREEAARVADAVLSLPPEVREVVVLRHYHDLPFQDVARLVGAPVTTVQARMARGLAALRARLRERVS